MAIVNAKEILLPATEGKYSVGAFNITNIIMMEGVIEAAVEKNAPLIIQTSVSPSRFLKPEIVVAAYRILAESAPIPICLHLDHCDEVEYCKTCADVGYTNLMMDASKNDFEENIRQTAEVSDYCHGQGDLSVEGELGTVSGVEDQVIVAEDEAALCNEEQAFEFVERSKIDIFAPAIGTAHGLYKTKNPKIDFERLGRINEIINGSGAKVPLVVHGGSGLSEEVVKELVSRGGAKFNVSTDLKYTWIGAISKFLAENPNLYNTSKLDVVAKDAIRAKIGNWIDLLGSAGKA
ncbi:MAG: class II fructose-bisphosphate aldolase family protein [Desulfotalea sp.]